MAEYQSEVDIKIKGTINQGEITKQLGDVKSQFETFSKSLGDTLNKGFSVAFGVGLAQLGEKAIEVAKDFAKESIKAFAEADRASKDLQNSLSNIGKSEFLPQLAKQAEDLANKYSFSAKSIEKAQSDLVTQNELSVNQVEKLQPIIANLARKTGQSYEESAHQIQLALEGNGKALKQFGVKLDKGATAEQNFNKITTELGDKLKGSADAFNESAEGGIAKYQHSLEKLEEQLGSKLFPILGELAKIFSEVLDNLQPVEDVIISIITPLEDMGKEIGNLIKDLTGWDAKTTTVADTMQFLSKVLKISMIPLKLIINSVIVAAKEFGHLAKITKDVFSGDFKGAIEEGKQAVTDYADGVVKSIQIVKDGFTQIPKIAKETSDEVVEEKKDLSKRTHKLTKEEEKKLEAARKKEEARRAKEYKERIKEDKEFQKQIYENNKEQSDLKKTFGATDEEIDQQFNDIRIKNAWMTDAEIYKVIQKELQDKKDAADAATKIDDEFNKRSDKDAEQVRKNHELQNKLETDFFKGQKDAQQKIDDAYQEYLKRNSQGTFEEFAKQYREDADKKKASIKDASDFRKQMESETMSALNDLANLFSEMESDRRNQSKQEQLKHAKESFYINKALGLVNVGISTGEAIAAAAIGPPGLPSPSAIAGIVMASVNGAAQIAAIAAKQFNPGSLGNGSSSAPKPNLSGGGSQAQFQPQSFFGLGGSQLQSPQQLQQNQQVYVTTTDLNNAMGKVNVTTSRSKIG